MFGSQIPLSGDSCTGTLASTLGALNPFRYRGYVYDEETGFYYLQSRYYDPTTGRFVSADVMLSTGQGVLGHNCYAYCLGNPVNRLDTGGNDSEEIDLGSGWTVQTHTPENGKKHIHIWNKKKNIEYSQNEDGSPHDKHRTKKGKLPNWLQKKVKEKTGWDYNGNRKEFFSKTESEIIYYMDNIEGNHCVQSMVVYSFADGSKIQRKRSPVFETIVSKEDIYFEGSNVVLHSDIAIINYSAEPFFLPIFELPILGFPEFFPLPCPAPVF